MPYIPVPKDLTRVKTKFLFNLTKRQLVCFGGGALVGIPLFFLLKGPLGNSSAAICMIVVMMPFFLFALYEKNGLPLEKYKFRQKKPATSGDTDLDDYEFPEDDEEDEAK